MILAPAIMAAESDPKNAADKCLQSLEALDADKYRIGHTKARNYLSLRLSNRTPQICFKVDIFTVTVAFFTPSKFQ